MSPLPAMFEIVIEGACEVRDKDGNLISETTFSSRPVTTIRATADELREQFGIEPPTERLTIDVPLAGIEVNTTTTAQEG